MNGPADPSLVEHVRRLRHDLGKYVSLQVRWLGEDPEADALREAVVQDVLHTRRGPSGSTSAGEVWSTFREPLVEALGAHPEVVALQEAMQELDEALPSLRAGTSTDGQIREVAAVAARVTACCRALLRDLSEQR